MTDWGSGHRADTRDETGKQSAAESAVGPSPRPPPGAAQPAEPDRPSDEQLIRAVAGGDREAIGELYRRHRQQLYATALYTVRTAADAEDCVQDAFVRAITLATHFRGDCKVSSWLHRIVINACLDRLRRNRVRVGLRIPDDWADTHADDRNPLPDIADLIALRTGLAALSPEYRDAVLAVDLLGMSIGEAAKLLQIAPGTVKSRRARARAKLARHLA